jgi:hypothetical protein
MSNSGSVGVGLPTNKIIGWRENNNLPARPKKRIWMGISFPLQIGDAEHDSVREKHEGFVSLVLRTKRGNGHIIFTFADG